MSNYKEVLNTIPNDICLVAVSKTKPIDAILEKYNQGQRIFGENKVQELVAKYEGLPKDIEWHLIGHLQTNKVKYIAPFVSLIHSIDSLKLLKEVNKEAKKNNRVINCLLQFHIAQEETKYGLNLEEAKSLLESEEFIQMENVSVVGIMGMASFSDDENQVRDEFRILENTFSILKSHYFKFNDNFKEISMGMSGDYKVAIEEGSTMIRVGSLIFGNR
ncbi:MAG: YggS family pyridoxal phosphate-dependent enzyme [Crocinitomicaceae bacterium]